MNDDRIFRVRSFECLAKYGSMTMEFVPLSDYRELEAQIEKMKCCDNCGHGKAGGYTCPFNCACDHDKKIFKDWKPR